jgi:hypothetical protein
MIDMSFRLPSQRVLLLALAFIVLLMSALTVVFRVKEQKLDAQNQKLLAQIRDLQSPTPLATAAQRDHPSVLLDAPITEKTALSIFWFGDMDSHFRNPVNFFVVPDADGRLHKVEHTDFITDGQVNMFVSSVEMKRLLEGLKALGLYWSDSRGRKAFEGRNHRVGTDMLDVTLVDTDSTGEAHIRITHMCASLDRLDSTMPTPRILWQFRTFRWDNGCEILGYENHRMPAE